MKKLSLALVLCLVIGMFAGCAGTPVIYYTDCTCPAGSHDVAAPAVTEPAPAETEAPVLEEGALKTGMFIMTGISDSKSATAEAEGEAKYDVTVVAVLVDDEGIIHDCIIDGIAASVKFDASGAITTDLAAAPQTKNELGENYGMVAWGGAVAEWDAQAAALADFVVGKNVGQLQGVAVSESGYAPEGSDLATSATIYLGGYVKAIELAAASAQHLGAQSGDELKMAIITGIGSAHIFGKSCSCCSLIGKASCSTARISISQEHSASATASANFGVISPPSWVIPALNPAAATSPPVWISPPTAARLTKSIHRKRLFRLPTPPGRR